MLNLSFCILSVLIGRCSSKVSLLDFPYLFLIKEHFIGCLIPATYLSKTFVFRILRFLKFFCFLLDFGVYSTISDTVMVRVCFQLSPYKEVQINPFSHPLNSKRLQISIVISCPLCKRSDVLTSVFTRLLYIWNAGVSDCFLFPPCHLLQAGICYCRRLTLAYRVAVY